MDKYKVDIEGSLNAGTQWIWVNRKKEQLNYEYQIEELEELAKYLSKENKKLKGNYLWIENVKLIFSDLDDTLSVLYKPASDKVKFYLNRLLHDGKSIVIISGQGK